MFAQSAAGVAKMAAFDSLAAVRKYHNTKHYKDSVANSRKTKAKTMKLARLMHVDSLKQARAHGSDSLSAIRKGKTDSLKGVQKERAEKVAKVKKYKGSKRFSDSVAIHRREHLDSIKRVQKIYKDGIASVRQKELNISKNIRKHQADSMKLSRTKVTDSIKLVRKRRVDSLNKVKLAKDKTIKGKDKQSEEKKKLALILKMKSKREAFTNKSMLKKKWSVLRRFTQNSFTHYNYYYNANRKLEEANANMLRGGQKENYDSLIKLYPFDPDRDSSLLAADMDSIIRKVSVGIQIHDPRVKWGNDMYLLMGQAYYYKGKYNDAATTFKYIISNDEDAKKKEGTGSKTGGPASIVEEEKSKLNIFQHKSVHNDAIIWLARTYTQMRMVENGQAVLSLLSTDPNLPEDLVGKVAAGRAFGYIGDNNYTAASEQLAIVTEDPYLPDWLRMRAAFLNGQILQNEGKHLKSAESFERSLDFFPKIDMDFFARKYIAFNTLEAGKDVGEGLKPLKKVLNDGKYVSYYDQVYYVMGQMAAKANKPDDAIKYLTQSATTPKASKKQKAISYAALGDVYYGKGEYAAAKNAYDSASKYAGPGSKDANIIAATQKSKGLAEISGPVGIINDQDSLMELSALSHKEQLSAVRKYIQELEKKINDSTQNALDAGSNTNTAAEAANDPAEASNWYFANPSVMQQGSNDFKRKWGNRQLTDNWRRSTGQAIPATQTNQSGIEEDNNTAETKLNDKGLPTEESLLNKIPNSKDQKELSNRITQRAYINLAKAYLKQLDDYKQSGNTLDTLDSRFPNHNQKEEELYLRYQLAIRQGKLGKAQEYSAEFLSKFPSSAYADLMRPRKEDAKLASANGGKPVSQYYDETYELIIKHQYAQALSNIDVAKKEYNKPVYRKRFQVAEAMTYVGQGNLNMADTIINGFMAANPSDSLSGWAMEVSEFIKDVRKNGVPLWYKNQPVWDNSQFAAATKAAAVAKPVVKPPPPKVVRPPDVPIMFTNKPEEEHYGMLILSGLDSRTLKLKRAIQAADSAKGAMNAHSVFIDLYSIDEIIFLIKKFHNAQEAKAYIDAFINSPVFSSYKPGEVNPFIISANNYRKVFYEQETDGYKNYYTVQRLKD